MNRKEFLKHCGLGICGCAVGALGPREARAASTADPGRAAPPAPSDQRLPFARHQLAKLVGFMAASPGAASCAQLIGKTGRECARLGGLGKGFPGNPAGYFAEARKAYGTEFRWDREMGVVTVTVPEGECGCPLVDARRMPAFWCNCSVGYQEEVFEAVFERPVEVSLKASKLMGSKTCVFEVRVK